MAGFHHWYNETHRHSTLKFITLEQRHQGDDINIPEERQRLYEASNAKKFLFVAKVSAFLVSRYENLIRENQVDIKEQMEKKGGLFDDLPF